MFGKLWVVGWGQLHDSAAEFDLSQAKEEKSQRLEHPVVANL